MAEYIKAGGLEFMLENRVGEEDGGLSLQVLKDDGIQVLRFDMFRVKPHYHYAPDEHNKRYDLDPLLLGDGVAWTMGLLSSKLAPMLTKAGYENLLQQISIPEIRKALPNIEARWRAQAA